MINIYYDFHIHSCLSPCGDMDMTPNNLVNMAKLLGHDAIALTDHNTARNCPAAAAVAEQLDMLFVPGMELCTSEEAHIVCLFPDVDSALAFSDEVEQRTPFFRNDPDKLGKQVIMDEDDEIIGEIEGSLLMASDISIDEVPALIGSYGGVAYPAHIDRDSYSVIASLGVFPEFSGYTACEITGAGDVAALTADNPCIGLMPKILSSDAHYLENMIERSASVELPERTAKCLIEAIKGNIEAVWRR